MVNVESKCHESTSKARRSISRYVLLMDSELPLTYLAKKANYGFSLGINDIPGPELRSKKEDLVEKAYADCQDLIALAKKGKLENKPGCDQDQTLEAMISSVLSKVRESVGHDQEEEMEQMDPTRSQTSTIANRRTGVVRNLYRNMLATKNFMFHIHFLHNSSNL